MANRLAVAEASRPRLRELVHEILMGSDRNRRSRCLGWLPNECAVYR